MILFLMKIFIYMTIIMLLLILNFMLMKSMFKNMEKMSPFECGFDPMSVSRLPFSLQFYLIGMIFLIFDVEISLLLPLIKCIKLIYMMIFFNISMMIIYILMFGLLIEWKEGALKWFK